MGFVQADLALHKNAVMYQSTWLLFTNYVSFKIRYCMALYLKGHRKYNFEIYFIKPELSTLACHIFEAL